MNKILSWNVFKFVLSFFWFNSWFSPLNVTSLTFKVLWRKSELQSFGILNSMSKKNVGMERIKDDYV